MFDWLRSRRRRKLLEEPFPSWWETILSRNVRHFPLLSPDEKTKLRDTARILIAEKRWEGCGGLFVTDEMKVTIAANAALLLLGGVDPGYYRRVPSIIVYPDEFRTPNPEDDWEDDELSDTILEGQAVYRGPVILSWNNVLAESREHGSGQNVVIHEFAHQLDFEDNSINGTPPLENAAMEKRWSEVMTPALEEHRRDLNRGHETFFSEHAAESETEFFADASEAFFCCPHVLHEQYPTIFAVLADYYRVDPLRWFERGK